MKRLTTLLLTAAIALSSTAQTAREEIRANKYLAGSNYLDYNRQLPTKKLTPAPKGYVPYYMSHYGRHGSRWLINDGTEGRQADSQGRGGVAAAGGFCQPA